MTNLRYPFLTYHCTEQPWVVKQLHSTPELWIKYDTHLLLCFFSLYKSHIVAKINISSEINSNLIQQKNWNWNGWKTILKSLKLFSQDFEPDDLLFLGKQKQFYPKALALIIFLKKCTDSIIFILFK